MGTRGIIARPTPGDGFEGRYHHWDSYPEGLGATLYNLANSDTFPNLHKMMAFLIDEHPAGWSTINRADWSMSAGYHDEHDGPCAVCPNEAWKHYTQNYESHGEAAPKPFELGKYAVYDHFYEPVRLPHGPQCYCHGARAEDGSGLYTQDGNDGGAEYAYVIDADSGNMAVLKKIYEDGRHATGFFGVSQNEAMASYGPHWTIRALVPLNGPEPDWKHLIPEEAEAV